MSSKIVTDNTTPAYKTAVDVLIHFQKKNSQLSYTNTAKTKPNLVRYRGALCLLYTPLVICYDSMAFLLPDKQHLADSKGYTRSSFKRITLDKKTTTLIAGGRRKISVLLVTYQSITDLDS